eukprot:6534169-Lingulodinium_polyedra.AAC.1
MESSSSAATESLGAVTASWLCPAGSGRWRAAAMVMPGRRPALREACRSAVVTPAASRTASTTGGCNVSYGCACRGSGLSPPGRPSPA